MLPTVSALAFHYAGDAVDSYQFTWMSVHPECNTPVGCMERGAAPKVLLLLGDSIQRFFLGVICERLGGHSEVSWAYDIPSNCSVAGGHHISHQHLLGMSPQPPYFLADEHDGHNATTRFNSIMQALPGLPDLVVLNSGLWDLARHADLTESVAVIEGREHYPTLTALQDLCGTSRTVHGID